MRYLTHLFIQQTFIGTELYARFCGKHQESRDFETEEDSKQRLGRSFFEDRLEQKVSETSFQLINWVWWHNRDPSYQEGHR
jgi:hypothetical protein